jgi:hypothetical protein
VIILLEFTARRLIFNFNKRTAANILNNNIIFGAIYSRLDFFPLKFQALQATLADSCKKSGIHCCVSCALSGMKHTFYQHGGFSLKQDVRLYVTFLPHVAC